MATETQAGAPVAPAGAGPLLRLTGVSKRFGAVQALSDVALEVRAGEVVALVGDNGAGKSTLIKTISGAGPADTGEIAFGGSPVRIASPADAARLGIAVVYRTSRSATTSTSSRTSTSGASGAAVPCSTRSPWSARSW